MQDKDQKTQEVIESLLSQLKAAESENALLRQKLELLVRRIFGQKSEQLDAKQLELLLSGAKAESPEENEAGPQEKPATKPRKRGRGRFAMRTPENLEVVEEVLIPDSVKANPDEWKEIGREENRRLDYQPGKFFWRVTVRPKYVRRDNRLLPPVIEPAPLDLSLGGRATAGFMAYLLVSRFCDHLPYYRQQALYMRQHSVWISRQQMVEWVKQCVEELQRVVSVMRDELRGKRYLQIDESAVRYQDKERAGPCPKGWLWVGLDPGQAVVFHWDQSRSAKGLENFIGSDFKGLIGVDGYGAYRAYASGRKDVELIGCWVHARRKFVEAQTEAPRIAGWVLNQIGWLFHWEAQWKGLSAIERQRMRASHSRPVVERLIRAFDRLTLRYRPESLMREAINYSINQWDALQAFLEHGEAELSNNLVENAIRPSAVGKRNWLFIGELEAGDRSAVVYSLTETCRMLGVNPYDYLKDVLSRLPGTPEAEVKDLTPANWAKIHPAATHRAA